MSNSTLADPLYPVLLNVPSTCVTRLISPPPYEPPPPSVPELATDPLVSQPELSSALEAAMSATISHTASCTTEQTAGTNPQQSSMSLSLSVEIPPHQQVSWSLQSSSHVSPLAEPKEQTASLSIGNLYMSSCPGKKGKFISIYQDPCLSVVQSGLMVQSMEEVLCVEIWVWTWLE